MRRNLGWRLKRQRIERRRMRLRHLERLKEFREKQSFGMAHLEGGASPRSLTPGRLQAGPEAGCSGQNTFSKCPKPPSKAQNTYVDMFTIVEETTT